MAIDYIGVKETFEKFRKRYLDYAKVIKKEALKFFGSLLKLVVVFGSTVEGGTRPLSDIDIAIVLGGRVGELDRAKFRVSINKLFGLHPFEIHIITIDEWENWYRRFVRKYIII